VFGSKATTKNNSFCTRDPSFIVGGSLAKLLKTAPGISAHFDFLKKCIKTAKTKKEVEPGYREHNQ
jgi:hypothetical protein